MESMDFPTTLTREGTAHFLIPRLDLEEKHLDRARSLAPVFFNERMKLNRDSAVLAVNVLGKQIKRPFSVCEPMCGTGIRGIRLALEVEGVNSIVLGDLNRDAVRLAQRNVEMNQLLKKISVRLLEANLMLSLHAKPFSRFDYVDIDPYGSPASYLDNAIRACKNDGLIALTATDMAPLCGINPKACLRKYGGRPLRTEYCHESALRIVAKAMIEKAAIQETAAHPVFSYSADHYIRLYFRLEKGKKQADNLLKLVGYLLHCFKCKTRKLIHHLFTDDYHQCPICGSKMRAAGPMWLGKLAETSYCYQMLDVSERSFISSNKRLTRIIRLVSDEIDFLPGFYNIDKISSRLKVSSVSIEELLFLLADSGYKVARTHICNRGLKTDASVIELENAIENMKS